ncbi:hypothetical protein BRADI_4g30235v3 [Brachypodium distachyon]|uniref:Uncharacterized protein n=1 Tax=Brachypodium distachyon TaxID=15368 RepID=A0A2K2CRA2_BRADI|nr:hypothetical protein BRADI_4g30235v3 [Brachypodium distachyon]
MGSGYDKISYPSTGTSGTVPELVGCHPDRWGSVHQRASLVDTNVILTFMWKEKLDASLPLDLPRQQHKKGSTTAIIAVTRKDTHYE